MSNRKASAQDGNWEAAAAATRTSLRPICSLLRAAALTAHCPSSLCTCSHGQHRQHCIPSLCTYMLTRTGSSTYCPSSLCTCSHGLTQAYAHTDNTAYLVFAHTCSLKRAAAHTITAHCPASPCKLTQARTSTYVHTGNIAHLVLAKDHKYIPAFFARMLTGSTICAIFVQASPN